MLSKLKIIRLIEKREHEASDIYDLSRFFLYSIFFIFYDRE